MNKIAAYETLLNQHPLWEKTAQPKLISISNMSDQEVRDSYNALISMAKQKKAKADASKPGSLGHRFRMRQYNAHMRDANSFLAK